MGRGFFWLDTFDSWSDFWSITDTINCSNSRKANGFERTESVILVKKLLVAGLTVSPVMNTMLFNNSGLKALIISYKPCPPKPGILRSSRMQFAPGLLTVTSLVDGVAAQFQLSG